MKHIEKAYQPFYFLLAVAVLLLIFGRIPSLSNDFCDPDVAVMSYGAIDVLNGGSIYERCVETKPPGAYLMFAGMFALFGKSLTPIYVLALLLHLAALALVALMAWRIHSPIAGVFAALFYALLATEASAAANCPNQETWMTFFAVFGFVLLLPGRRILPFHRALLSGLCFGIAVLMKQQAAVFVVAGVVWLALEWPRPYRQIAAMIVVFLVGVSLSIGAVIVVWAIRGGLETMLTDLHPSRLRQYVSAGDAQEMTVWAVKSLTYYSLQTWPAWITAIIGLLIGLRKKEVHRQSARIGFYFLAAAFALVSGSRFYSHYFIILAAPLALAGGFGIGMIDRQLKYFRWRMVILAVLALATVAIMDKELRQSWRMLSLWMDDQQVVNDDLYPYCLSFDDNLKLRIKDKKYQRLGEYIKQNSSSDDFLYVWPYVPQLYFWADRRSPTKHYMYFDLATNLPFKFGGWHSEVDDVVRRARKQLFADLEAARPVYIILSQSKDDWNHAFDELDRWVEENYILDENAPEAEVRVFRRQEAAQ